MEKIAIVSLILLLLFKTSNQITVPDDEQYQKPVTYSSGIKTYKRPSQVQFHHNYSRVYHQNGYSSDNSYYEEQSERPYPVYNAHTYGNRPLKNEQLTVYVINGTRVRKNENPTRQVMIYNKSKRTPKVEIYKTCPDKATGQFVYESSCNQFLNCWKGRGYVQNCPAGTLFNPKTLECDFPEKVQCISGPRNILERERSAKIINQIGCPKEFSGLIPNYTDCSKFINCVSGIENFMDCPQGTLFDIDKNICDFPHKANCFNGQNQKLKEENINGKLDFGSARCGQCSQYSQTGGLSYKHNEVRCPHGAIGLQKHPTDCSKFLNCANGVTYVQDCSPGTLFNPQLKICDFPYNVRCENQQGGTDTQYNIYGGTSGYNQQQHGSSHYNRETSGYNQNEHGTIDQYTKGASRYNQQQHGAIDQYNREASRYNQEQHSNVGQYNREVSGYNQNQHGAIDQYNQQHGTYDGIYNHHQQSSGLYSSTPVYHKPQYGINNQYNKGVRIQTNQYENNQNYNPYGSSTPHYASSGSSGHYNRDSRIDHGTNQGRWNQNYHDKGSSIYAPSNGYVDSNQQHTTTFYHNGVPVPTRRYNKGSVSVYHQESEYSNQGSIGINHRGETGVYGVRNRTADGYRDGNIGTNYQHQDRYSHNYGTQGHPTNTYGTYGVSNQHIWGQSSTRPTTSYNYSPQYENTQNNRYKGAYIHQQGQYPERGTNQQTNWSLYHQKPNGYNVNNQYEGNNRLDQDQLNGRDNTYNHRGETGYGLNHQSGWRQPDEGPVSTNYDEVVNIHHITKTTPYRKPHDAFYGTTEKTYYSPPQSTVPFRKPYEPFFGTTEKHHYQSRDYDDTFGGSHTTKRLVTTPRAAEMWPPPFPSTDLNADYVFEYDDGDEVTLEAENALKNDEKDGTCGKSDFRCSIDKCIPKTLVCNGAKDCPSGNDELKCLEYVSKFSISKNHKLAILEKERWNNVSIATCALLCIEARKFQCKSFNYRKIDKTCFLTNTNEGLTGALISYQPCDFYELISEKIDCSNKFTCNNKKCISRSQICDGNDDCGDRMDEKNCKVEDFGYSIKLAGSKENNEGRIEVTAFGRTGYICDDKFGLRDADVACRELGFYLGAVEVKGNSFFAKNFTTDKPFYMMDDITCLGNETKLMDCDFSGWGVHNCLTQEIVGVVCKTPQEKCAANYWQCDTGQECIPLLFVCDGLLDCKDGSDEAHGHCDAPTEVRLVNGTSRNEGRVEIRHHGIWGTICDDDFNEDAAKVICRHLGYKGSAEVKKEGFYGPGNGPVWLDQVYCSGNETSIENCVHWDWGEHNCEHTEDVGVVCRNIFETERHAMIPMPKIPQDFPDTCGLRNNIFNLDDGVHMRVVGSFVAKKGDYPWQASLRVKSLSKPTHWCGAVIVSEKFVLTAAHCLLGYPKGAYVVAAGDYDVDENEGTEQEAYIEDYYLHEDFRQGHKMNNDIAIIKLKGRGFRFNENVQPICLPEKNTRYEEHQNCTISGFGSTEYGKAAYSHTLRAGWVPIQKREICTMPHVYGDEMKEGMFCAGSLDGGTDGCRGDSGGPLACLHNGVFTLYGITSWGHHCGYANKPGVYVKVAHYRKWIDEKFQKHSVD